ncbi:MAG: hypothetical protein WC506_01545 [Candidatus Micrarchaeia archaeon]
MDMRIEYRPVVVLALVFLLMAALVCAAYWKGALTYEQARIIEEALSIIVTVSVLFSAFLSLEASRQKAVSASELASRPDLHWNVVPAGNQPKLEIESRKNQAFDFVARLECNGVSKTISERHLEESQDGSPRKYTIPLGDFFSKAIAQGDSSTVLVDVTFYSELGGRYNYAYSKKVSREKSGFKFSQRNLVMVTLPWFDKPRTFSQEE